MRVGAAPPGATGDRLPGHSVQGDNRRAEKPSGDARHGRASTTGPYCAMYRRQATFCTNCHGVGMPHPEPFIKTHGPAGKKTPAVCSNCHAKGEPTASGTEFCNACHHKQGGPAKPWIPPHFVVVRDKGADACSVCHTPTVCAPYHVQGAGHVPQDPAAARARERKRLQRRQ